MKSFNQVLFLFREQRRSTTGKDFHRTGTPWWKAGLSNVWKKPGSIGPVSALLYISCSPLKSLKCSPYKVELRNFTCHRLTAQGQKLHILRKRLVGSFVRSWGVQDLAWISCTSSYSNQWDSSPLEVSCHGLILPIYWHQCSNDQTLGKEIIKNITLNGECNSPVHPSIVSCATFFWTKRKQPTWLC